jgi:hypothetical protein
VGAKNSTLLVAVGESVFTKQWSFLPPESVEVGTFSPVSVSLMGSERTTGDVCRISDSRMPKVRS